MLDRIVDRLGRMSWDDQPSVNEDLAGLGPPYDLVFGALDLMDSDIREIIDTLNAHMNELRESQYHLEIAQQVARLGSWEWHVSSGVLKWSDETFRIFGHPPRSVEPTYPFFLKHLDPESRQKTETAVRAAIDEDRPFNVQHVIIRPDKSQAVAVSRGYVERDEAGQPIRMYGTTHDITELESARTAERRLHEEMAIRESALRETLLDLSHDVRTPLASIKLGLGRICTEHGHRGLQSSLIAEVEYLDGLFSNLIALVRLKSSTIELKLSPTSLLDVLDRVKARLSILAQDRRISLDISRPEDDIMVHADPLAIEQAVGNLVHNAIKFASAHVAILSNMLTRQRSSKSRRWAGHVSHGNSTGDRSISRTGPANKAGRGLGLGLPIACDCLSMEVNHHPSH